MAECHVPFWVTVILTSDLVFKNYCVRSISLIFFQVGILNSVCICILGCRSVAYHFRVTVTLTSDLVLRNDCGRSLSFILFKIGIPNLVCECILG